MLSYIRMRSSTKSVEQNILEFFRTHSEQVWNSGDLQRMTWFNKNGTIATPRSVVRRLQELAEAGKIVNLGDLKSARYQLNTGVIQPKLRQVIEYTKEGTVKINYVPC